MSYLIDWLLSLTPHGAPFYDTYALLINTAIYASVTAVFIIIFKLIFKNRLKARWHFLIWAILLIRLVIPVLPSSPVSVFNAVKVEESVIEQSSYQAEIITPEPEEEYYINTESNFFKSKSVLQSSDDSQDYVSILNVDRIVILSWLGGAVILIVYFAIVFALYNRRLKKRRTQCDEKTLSALSSCKEKLGIKRNVRLYFADTTPVLIGLFKPAIYIPDSYGDTELEAVITHELCHLKHLDILWSGIAALVLCLNWYNPVIWLSFFMFKRDLELYCDERTLKYTQNKQGYALLLLKTAAKKQFVLGTTSLQSGKSDVKRRIRYLANFKKPTVLIIIAAVLAAAIITTVCLTNAAKTTSGQNTFDYPAAESVSEEQIKELRQLLYFRINGSGITSGYYDEVKEIIPDIQLNEYEATADGKTEKYYYALLRCDNRKIIICFDSLLSEGNEIPNISQGFLEFTDIIDSQTLSQAKNLRDVYKAENLNENNPEDYGMFWGSIASKDTMICIDFGNESLYTDSDYGFYCTEKGLLAVEYAPYTVDGDAGSFKVEKYDWEVNKPNFDCVVRSVNRYNEPIFSTAYECVYKDVISGTTNINQRKISSDKDEETSRLLSYSYDPSTQTFKIKGVGEIEPQDVHLLGRNYEYALEKEVFRVGWIRDYELIPNNTTEVWRETITGIPKTIDIENGITAICANAFEGGSSGINCGFEYTERVNLPDSLKRIDNFAFTGCENLSEIELPKNLTVIDSGAFLNCRSLKSITIPDRVDVIGRGAFSGCESLEEVTLGENTAIIGNYAFYGTSLKEINLSDGFCEIGDYAFFGCDFTSVTIPDTVFTIGEKAFGYTQDGKIDGFTIRGYAESTAEWYAKENGFKFEEITE